MRLPLSAIFLCLATAVSPAYQDALTPPSAKDWSLPATAWTTGTEALEAKTDGETRTILKGRTAADFQLDVEVRAAAGAEAGVLFRADEGDDGAGYFAGIRPGDGVAMWSALEPKRRDIASRPLGLEPGRWYHLRLQAAGENFRVFLEPQPVTDASWPVFDGVDAGFGKGNIGLRAAHGSASFRNLRIVGYQPRLPAKTYTNPVQAGGADPMVYFHKGKYYAYTTYTGRGRGRTQGIRLHTSANLVDWKDEGFAVTDRDSWGDSGFWAPDLVEKDGTFYLYYAANERMCVATAKSPMGPFRQEKKEPMLPESIRIDGHVFRDDDGRHYFYYVSFGQGNEIWGGRLNDDMLTVDRASLRRMIAPDQPWERHQGAVTEGPEVLKHKGVYYLTYSGSHYRAPEYAVGYATSDSPLGPWKKYDCNPVMKSTSYARGTAHHCFAPSPDGKETFIIYHRHRSPTQVNPRDLAIDRVRFQPDPKGGPDILQVHGPTASPQPMPSGAR